MQPENAELTVVDRECRSHAIEQAEMPAQIAIELAFGKDRARHDLAHQQRRSHRLFHPFDRPDVALRVVIAVGIQLLLRPDDCIQAFELAGPFWPEL